MLVPVFFLGLLFVHAAFCQRFVSDPYISLLSSIHDVSQVPSCVPAGWQGRSSLARHEGESRLRGRMRVLIASDDVRIDMLTPVWKIQHWPTTYTNDVASLSGVKQVTQMQWVPFFCGPFTFDVHFSILALISGSQI